jgi:hypothetical protein
MYNNETSKTEHILPFRLSWVNDWKGNKTRSMARQKKQFP